MSGGADTVCGSHGPAAPVGLGRAWFDPAAMRLLVDGQDTRLEPLPMALLCLLLSRRGEVVTKAQIFDVLWSDRSVSESSLTKCVARLRSALGDDGHVLIRTVHGSGYRLEQAPTPADAQAAQEPGRSAPAAAVPAGAIPNAASEPLRRRAKMRRAAYAGAALALCALLALLGRPATSRPVPPEAQALYMKGMQHWAQRTPVSLTRAVAEFTAALRLDPLYAKAHAGLAFCYNLLPEYAAMPSAQAFPLARGEAKRAIALEPGLAGAHSAHAFALFWGDWAFDDALREYEAALRLEPGNATAHHWYANSLDNLGRHTQALGEIDRALELDPASVSIQADRALILFHVGHRNEAKDVLSALAARAPDFLSPHAYLATIALTAGDNATYLREWAVQARLQRNAAAVAIVVAAQAALNSGGEANMRRALLDARLTAFAGGAIPATDVAYSYALLGDVPHAVEYLNLAIDRHDPAVIFILNGPEFGPMMNNPAIGAVLARLGVKPPTGF